MITAFDWRRALVYTHRWLGIAGGLLIVLWFASGIVMVYQRMPALAPEERLERLSPLDLSSVRVGPAEAAERVGGSLRTMRVAMLWDRPVYRFGTSVTFADSGEPMEGVDRWQALALARGFAPEHSATATYDVRLTEPDQWTLQDRAFLPMHRILLGDPEDTRLYVSESSGEVVMKTTRSGRRWAYAGAVLHWLYFTPFRVHTALWSQTIIWLSILGCLLTLSGLVWGVWRFTWRSRPDSGRSPYAGLLRWHHYAGLLFGFFSFTWLLSGGLSMEPWSWHPGTSPTPSQSTGVAGGTSSLDDITASQLREGAAALAAVAPAKELGLVQFAGTGYLLAEPRSASAASRLVEATEGGASVFGRFSDDDIRGAARAAMPGVPIVDERWLDTYDSYYYGRAGSEPPLPVLRVRYADPQRTWLYLDPGRGVIVRKEERLTRLNRWLYHGFHSLDFPLLYESRPLWDIVMIVLSLGGLAVAATTLLPGWQRLMRHARRMGGRS